MKLLWIKANKVGSKLIQWGLDSDCSHFAISFDEDARGRGIAFHSYGSGTQLEWLRDFKKKYTVVHSLQSSQYLNLADEESIYKAILEEEAGRSYDYPALIYFALVVAWNKLTGRKNLPIKNRWQRSNMRLCTGIAPTVFKALSVPMPSGIDAEMVSPVELYEIALKSGRFFSTMR